jgi:hypothetical protein
MLQLTLPPNREPELQLYTRANSTQINPRIFGTVVTGRDTLYNFDLSAVPNGDYVVDIYDPYGRVMLRKGTGSYLLADEWWELDYLSNPATDPSKILVNQDYGGTGALIYALNGIPVADASIELFLYSDYMAGNRDGNYRINSTRQTVDGTWAIAFYLDPQDYVLRYYRAGIAGPDEWKLTAALDPADIEIIPLSQSGLGLAELRGALSLRKPAKPVRVDQHYQGQNNLVYRLNNKPVAGATILAFTADVYNSGNHLQGNAVASTEQDASGNWTQPMMLLPGQYVLHCFKKNAVGPNAYSLTVE